MAPATEPEHTYTLELCDKKGAYEAEPREPLDLDLASVEQALEAHDVPVLTNAGILLVCQAGPVEVSVFESGRLLLKTDRQDLAEAVTSQVYELLAADRQEAST